MPIKPSIPKGTRDFLPVQSLKRKFIFDTAQSVFQKYGYQPIETPAMENLETLTGKYGEEGDRLINKVLNNGNFLSKVDDQILESKDSQKAGPRIANRALRYDLTVPFARFVVQNQNELSFPFKRYQIQPVWRADRPQKGRYREFYQCDVDVIGSDSLLNEAELLSIIDDVFVKLGLQEIVIRLNNRKILSGIAQASGLAEHFTEMTIAIDKLDKIGVEGVKKEMIERGLPENGVKKALDHIRRKANPENLLIMLSGSLTGVEDAQRGVQEMHTTLAALPSSLQEKVTIDLTLARGLNYYTGTIIEVGHEQFPSSICGGGRYDDLTGIFGLEGMSGVGVSFGADRIYDLMEELNIFPDSLGDQSTMMFVNFGTNEAIKSMELARQLREAGYAAEVYLDAAKMAKQMKYANVRGFKYVGLLGSKELEENRITVKDMRSGEHNEVELKHLVEFIFDQS